VGIQLFHADKGTDGQTEMTKLIVAFRNFTKATKRRVEEELREDIQQL
jgi:hypothetical protein